MEEAEPTDYEIKLARELAEKMADVPQEERNTTKWVAFVAMALAKYRKELLAEEA